MPAGTTYFLKVGEDGLRFRYHADRNFVAFGGKQRPVNQDAVVQHIGFYGNVTLANPLHQAKLRGRLSAALIGASAPVFSLISDEKE